ncbi:type II toxin-antitoxin system VapC family toxin [Azospirillum sp. TSA2s]|uniref:type II toxin-antitoxin system VapC family toxin n=1 Tax=Azospirillum sp. TSA2s TaxID=709810 RepID=UPI0010AA96F0|nr:type II toxin-antitoxin system VapC family toxin [Azospirillum sp. TSA2s]QCG94654.1 type II toxin-antitoxin system VapC family toxin [Azospirillum sp. TSA2s]
MFLLDTNAISELRRPVRAHPGLLAWAGGVSPADLFFPAITLFKVELGAGQVGRRDAAQGAVLRAWIDTQVIPAFRGRILPVDAEVAQRCATLHVPDPRPQGDSLIAATALVHRLTVVTRNVRDFEPMGVALLNPWISN